ncbi:phosphate acetyltransferase [Campylobacter sp. faydin G-140]|uniref:phosphate acetyltransferase n=1 Tax=Campylobacter anatolicus TaxID=2829105 RepID=UPI001B9DF5ED|nr:phosphate acetyltransferase [Campylobacter anatolicus]MBR8465864.1 phosphate acetyltransferase [Campylobacter anatolicus]
MNACYILNDKNLPFLKEIISTKFKKVAIFDINFSQIEINKFINGDEKAVLLELIDNFEEIKANSDFVIVVGCCGFSLFGEGELNLKIAKNLNCPIYENENLKALKTINRHSKLLITSDINEILSVNQNIITPYKFERLLINRAAKNKKTIILPESDDERVLKATEILLAQGAVNLVLLGVKNEIEDKARKLGLNLDGIKVLDPKNSEYIDKFAKQIYELRKHKGLTQKIADKLAYDKIYFATMMIHNGYADAMVSGATMSTADTIRPALQIIKTKPNTKIVSGLFFIALDEEILLYADCAITPNPTADELASIAITSAQTAKAFGIEPHVAMLSYSTADSGSGIDVDLIKLAATKVCEIDPKLKIAAPIQYDAAVDLSVATKKMPNSDVAGVANVFIFPNLNCGNICYKAVQRSANALAIGPVLQGLNKPINDLSRGCLVSDIVNTALISAIQAGE